ncbi:hypothetical protein NIES4102_39420 (plasmid) [Chondrocystis sp. NIES-4102]|nr:hypothetical protein NIES4102_39420 [Chondrocystis sp. NIES-4102]
MVTHSHNRGNHQIAKNPFSRLKERSLSISTALITGSIYTICVLFLAVAPKATMAFFSYIFHADLTNLVRVVTWGSFITGLLFWSLGAALYAALIARLYNSFAIK